MIFFSGRSDESGGLFPGLRGGCLEALKIGQTRDKSRLNNSMMYRLFATSPRSATSCFTPIFFPVKLVTLGNGLPSKASKTVMHRYGDSGEGEGVGGGGAGGGEGGG